MTPQHVTRKATHVLTQVQQGIHPVKVRGRKLREYPTWFSIPLPDGYRLLLRFTTQVDGHRIVSHNDYDNLLKRSKNSNFLAT